MAGLKPMDEILAAMGDDVTTEQKTTRLYHELEKLGDEAPEISHQAVLERSLRLSFDLVINVFLDLAGDVGALPEGRDAASQDLHDALDFIRMIAVYEATEAAG